MLKIGKIEAIFCFAVSLQDYLHQIFMLFKNNFILRQFDYHKGFELFAF